MEVILTEKPSVAWDIAKVIGKPVKKEEWYESGGYYITWAFGHLVGLAPLAFYRKDPGDVIPLPFIPDKFKLLPEQKWNPMKKEWSAEASKVHRLREIGKLFDKCDSIVVATDAGREGELIFRYIYNYLGCTKPFKRLWISSMTEAAIRDGFNKLLPGHDFDPLYEAARCRSEADWTVGINGSRALTEGQGLRLSLGRVQTPTLALICKRYLENKNFKSEKYWQCKIGLQKDGIPFEALCQTKFSDPKEAGKITALCSTSSAAVTKADTKEVKKEAPLLFDITELQRKASSKYGYSPDQTLTIVQSLYEARHVTYPRTGSQYIPEDVYALMPALVAKFENYHEASFAAAAKSLHGTKLNHHSVNDTKITDHHALLPTEVLPTSFKDQGHERIYKMILGRMLEAFSPACVADSTSLEFECGGVKFTASGSVIKFPGWRGVYNDAEDKGEDEKDAKLPKLSLGETLKVQKAETLEKQTQPKPLLTDSSLLDLMKHAGKEVEDKELSAAIKECGLGTPATRANILQKIMKQEYVKKEKGKLIPTEKGLELYEVVKDFDVASVEMTARWEEALGAIADGDEPASQFDEGIRDYAERITTQLAGAERGAIGKGKGPYEGVFCPKCGAEIRYNDKAVGCKNKECDFVIWRGIAGKSLTDAQIKDILVKGISPLIKNFKGKSGKAFDAYVKLGDDFKTTFEFPSRAPKATGPAMEDLVCPKCGKPLKDEGTKLSCGCGFTMWKSAFGVALKKENVEELLKYGKTSEKVEGFVSKKTGKKYAARLALDRETGKISLDFDRNE